MLNRTELLQLLSLHDRTLSQLDREVPALAKRLRQTRDAEFRRAIGAHLDRIAPGAGKVVAEDHADTRPIGSRVRTGVDALKLPVEQRRKLEHVLVIAEREPPITAGAISTDATLDPILARARAEQLLALGGIAEGRVTLETPRSLDEATLAAWVRDRAITEPEARKLAITTTLFRLLDENAAHAEAAVAVRPARLTRIEDSRDLAAITAAEWTSSLSRLGSEAAAVATTLANALAALHPTDALIGRLPRPTAAELPRLDAAARTRLVNAYPGLELDALLADASLSEADKAARVHERITAIDDLRRDRPNLDLLALDYGPGSADVAALALAARGLDDADQRRVVRTLASFQRIESIADDPDEAATVLAAGFSSSCAIARSSAKSFAARTGLPVARAEKMWSSAQTRMAETAMTATSIYDGYDVFPHAPWNLHDIDAALDQLRQLEGFDELFGRQTYCACEHCMSIFSPAAYFVDTMAFVDQHIRDVYFSGANANHPLDLKSRRPDLWTLLLSCTNTDERIPTLDIINEVLENYIATRRGFAGALTNRPAVEQFVYADALAVTTDSYRQPFSRAHAALESSLAELGATRDQIADAIGVVGQPWTRAVLGITSVEHDLVAVTAPTLATQRRLLGVQFSVPITPIDIEVMMKATGDSRSDLGAALESWFVRAGTNHPRIVAGKSSLESVQFDVERVHDLDLANLDRLHRFNRIRRKLGVAPGELDYWLRTRNDAVLDTNALAELARLVRVMRRFRTSIEDTTALYQTPPTYTSKPDKPAVFDRVFNATVFVAASGAWPVPAQRFVHPVFRTANTDPGEPSLARLAASLALDIDRLGQLIERLAPALGFDPLAPNEDDRGFLLTRDNLALLYRHAKLATLLKLSIADLFRTIALSGIGGHVAGLASLEALVATSAQVRATGRTLDDIAIGLRQAPLDPTRVPDATSIATTIRTAAAEIVGFKPTLLSVQLGLPEADALAVIAANPTVFEAVGELVRLVAGDDGVAPLVIPPAITTSSDAIRAILLEHHPREIALSRLATELSIEPARLRALAVLTGASLASADFAHAVRGDGPPDVLEDLIRGLIHLGAAFPSPRYDAAALALVGDHVAAFGIASLATLTWPDLVASATYARLAGRLDEEAQPAVDAADLAVAIAAHGASGFPPALDVTMGRILGIGSGLVASLRGRVPVGANALATLASLETAAAMIAQLGVDGTILERATRPEYAAQRDAAAALRLAIVGRAATDEERDQRLERIDGPLRVKRRDALADFIVHAIHPELEDRTELYPYFLLDVDVDSCATTSRVVAAISSVQLYVQRALMNLEQDRRDVDDPEHIHVRIDKTSAAEWTWRKNYRVWEANRKVFLYPETYLEPDLRDDKTPLFEELEQMLLQQDVTAQSVLDAYTTYLAGFHELAGMAVAGAYHDVKKLWGGITSDRLHVFGATSTDPPIYYHRVADNVITTLDSGEGAPVWGPWRKIPLAIPGRKVSPVLHRGRLHLFWPEYVTRGVTKIIDGSSEFNGYQHTMSLRGSYQRLDGGWSTPQTLVMPKSNPFDGGPGLISDLKQFDGSVRFDPGQHPEARDSYTLSGMPWEWVWPEPHGSRIEMMGRNFGLRGVIDVFGRKVSVSDDTVEDHDARLSFAVRDGQMFLGHPLAIVWAFIFPIPIHLPRLAFANTVLRQEFWQQFQRELAVQYWEDTGDTSIDPSILFFVNNAYQRHVADVSSGTQLLAVPGAPENIILQRGADVLHLVGTHRTDERYDMMRIGTTLAPTIAKKLFETGVDGLLSLDFQRSLKQNTLPITLVGSDLEDRTVKDRLDFTGAYGTYFREIFFHVPWLIANHLNALGHYEEADLWYRYIFDPTSTEEINLPPGLSKDERARRLRDRVWRYLELRGLTPPSLRDILTEPHALAAYRADPFNPFAIARLRLSAFQKSIVMKYVDNLLDWADELFTQFTMESINEATMLYAMAADLLGPRPLEVGDCGEAALARRDYAHIAPLLDDGGVLVEIESSNLGRWRSKLRPKAAATYTHGLASAGLARVTDAMYAAPEGAARKQTRTQTIKAALRPNASKRGPVVTTTPIFDTEANAIGAIDDVVDGVSSSLGQDDDWRTAKAGAWKPQKAGSSKKAGGLELSQSPDYHLEQVTPGVGWAVLRQLRPVFCVPPNKDLLAMWDRVEDRLFKIRHCMDITGERREVALFAPEIDPRMLVRMRAAGMSLGDVLAATSGQLPPYRFTFLIEKARAYAGALQGFGSALLSALEKKDGEELALLRQRHAQNLARLTTRMREWELETSVEAIRTLERQLEAAEYRRDYHDGLSDTGLNGWEHAQSASRWTISGLHIAESILQTLTGGFGLIPNVGSPFAMTFGGDELHKNAKALANVSAAAAKSAEAICNASGLQAGFDRREEGWDHAKDLADHEIKSLKSQLAAAEVRKLIAERAVRVHEETVAQLDETYEMISGKLTGLGLYTWLAGELKTLYRGAYTNSLALARLAEEAYRFERDDQTSAGLALTYWDPVHAGLLAGDRLLVDLQSLERRFLETNHRTLEVDQAFSLQQIDPAALLRLRETGACDFTIPEWAFDLFYPGQYKRRIRGVRLTIPCVTGPYTNVGATLALDASWIRRTPSLAPESLIGVPPRRSVAISTSTAQNDGGVFELSFRDDRYMPFEGAGAISKWRLELPKTFRAFDYQTISDVVVSISYNAAHDGLLKEQVEDLNAAIEGSLATTLASTPMRRVISLRQEFSTLFTRLLHSPAGTIMPFELGERHLPFFLRGRAITIDAASLVLRVAPGSPVTGAVLNVDGAPVGGFLPSPVFAQLPTKPLPPASVVQLIGPHTIAIQAAGELAPNPQTPQDPSSLDDRRVQDILIGFDYRLTPV